MGSHATNVQNTIGPYDIITIHKGNLIVLSSVGKSTLIRLYRIQ